MQIKTGRFMFFITRLTENTNLAASIPASEQVFNAARVNIMLVRPRFADLDIANKPRPAVQQAFAHSAASGSGLLVGDAGNTEEGRGKARDRDAGAGGFEA